MATIKNERLDPASEHTRKQTREILDEVLTNAEQSWRQGGFLKKWIRDLTWTEDGRLLDYRHKFWRGSEDGHETEQFDNLCRWLEKQERVDRPGCYGFKKGDEYLYVGKAIVLRERIKQHEREVLQLWECDPDCHSSRQVEPGEVGTALDSCPPHGGKSEIRDPGGNAGR